MTIHFQLIWEELTDYTQNSVENNTTATSNTPEYNEVHHSTTVAGQIVER